VLQDMFQCVSNCAVFLTHTETHPATCALPTRCRMCFSVCEEDQHVAGYVSVCVELQHKLQQYPIRNALAITVCNALATHTLHEICFSVCRIVNSINSVASAVRATALRMGYCCIICCSICLSVYCKIDCNACCSVNSLCYDTIGFNGCVAVHVWVYVAVRVAVSTASGVISSTVMGVLHYVLQCTLQWLS